MAVWRAIRSPRLEGVTVVGYESGPKEFLLGLNYGLANLPGHHGNPMWMWPNPNEIRHLSHTHIRRSFIRDFEIQEYE